MHMHPSSLHSNGGYIVSFPPWRRRHDCVHNLRVLTSGCTVSLYVPLSLYSLKPCKTRRDSNQNLHCTCSSVLTFHVTPESFRTYYLSFQWRTYGLIAPSMYSCCYHLTMKSCSPVVIAVVLPRSSFKPTCL